MTTKGNDIMENKIAKIIERYPRPDQKLLPKVYLCGTDRNGSYMLDCRTGVKKERTSKYYRGITYQNMRDEELYVARGATLKYAYCKYHTQAGLIELAVVTMGNRVNDGARYWEYAENGERYFLDKEKTIYSERGTIINKDSLFRAYKYHSFWGFHCYLNALSRCNYNDKYMEEFKRFAGKESIMVGNGRHLQLDHAWVLSEWFKCKSYKKTTGKVQKLLDELTELPHTDLSDVCERYAPSIEDYTTSYGYTCQRDYNDVIYFECLNDKWSVLRYCCRQNNNGNIETYRVYISEDGKCQLCKLNDANEWVPAQNITYGWRSSYGKIVNFDDMAKCKRLSYIMPIIKEMKYNQQLPFLVSIIKFPEIERLYKMGYCDLAKKLLADNTVKANIKNTFGEPNKKAKTIFGQFGLNKYQLDEYMNKTSGDNQSELSGYHYRDGIITMKKYFGDDLSYLDNDTFDKLLLCVAQCRAASYYGVERLINGLNVDGKKFLKNISRLSIKHDGTSGRSQVITIMRDTIEAHHSLDVGTRPEIDWMFDSYSDLVRAHDAMVELRRIQQEERQARWNADAAERRKKEDEKRQKIDKERKSYEYEDTDFTIRLPKDCKEIVDEGTKQHICIGGYTTRHSLGQTNLFFLRRNSEPDKPFYAIEMNNDKNIVQIHGFGNKWLGNDPDAIPTVIRWLRKNGIKCRDTILTCTSHGYSSNGSHIAMPVVD